MAFAAPRATKGIEIMKRRKIYIATGTRKPTTPSTNALDLIEVTFVGDIATRTAPDDLEPETLLIFLRQMC
jgi:hypothetical protein